MDIRAIEKRLLAEAHIIAAMNGISVGSVEQYEMAHAIARLRAELATADAFHKVAVKARDYERTVVDGLWAELESWIEAFGLLSTLHETMPINADDPMGMAKQIESHVRATIERLREYAGHKPECIVLWMEEQEQYPCDCGYDDLVKEIGE